MRYFIFCLVMLLPSQAWADELKTIENVKTFTSKVMAIVESGDSVKAVELLRPHLLVPTAEFNLLLAQMKQQQPTIDARFGEVIGSEHISNKILGKSFLRIIYAQKYEHHAVRWVFYYYKPNDNWVLSTFAYNDEVKLFFE